MTVGSVMSSPAVVVPGEATSADALHQLQRQTHDAYPVVGHDGRAIGLLTNDELRYTLHYCYAILVRDIADRDPDLFVEPWVDAGLLLGREAFLRVRHAVVVNRDWRPVGIVSESDVLQALRIADARDAEPEESALTHRS